MRLTKKSWQNIKNILAKTMTKINQIYKCNICGNIIEVIHAGASALYCCNEAMEFVKETTDAESEGKEKHFPVIETKSENIHKITVGSIPHPMEIAHYIEWIEIILEDGKTERQFLNPDDKPEATFCVNSKILEIRS